ncbi:MAG TPA: chemotaxis protein CheW [Polyangiaceae bacterium]|nr:chemotaxis protein CheW [Polyangiaceae bacterium]
MASESFGRSRLGSEAQTGESARSGDSAGPARGNKFSLCTFWLGERCFALDTRLVGEVVTIEDKIPVPLAPPAVRGIFNLRGEPVPLVSFAELLGIGEHERRAGKETTAIVLRSGELVVGLIADRMEAVIPEGRGRLTPPAGSEDDRAILGFLEPDDGKLSIVVSVLDPAFVLARVSELRYLSHVDN